MEEIFFIKDGGGRRRGIESNLGGSSVENFFVLLFWKEQPAKIKNLDSRFKLWHNRCNDTDFLMFSLVKLISLQKQFFEFNIFSAMWSKALCPALYLL